MLSPGPGEQAAAVNMDVVTAMWKQQGYSCRQERALGKHFELLLVLLVYSQNDCSILRRIFPWRHCLVLCPCTPVGGKPRRCSENMKKTTAAMDLLAQRH